MTSPMFRVRTKSRFPQERVNHLSLLSNKHTDRSMNEGPVPNSISAALISTDIHATKVNQLLSPLITAMGRNSNHLIEPPEAYLPIRLRRTKRQNHSKTVVKGLVLQPGLLKKIVATRLMKQNLLENRIFEFGKCRVFVDPVEPLFHASLHRAKPINNLILNPLNLSQRFTFHHRPFIRLRYKVRNFKTSTSRGSYLQSR